MHIFLAPADRIQELPDSGRGKLGYNYEKLATNLYRLCIYMYMSFI